MPLPCHICGLTNLQPVPGYERFYRVTSDCKPWPRGGKLAVCLDCGCAQAVLDEVWRRDADRIYADYTIYHQSQGAVEQSVFDQATGEPLTRSARLVLRLKKEASLQSRGRLLDVGCGNGALLKAFAAAAPNWELFGAEVNDRYRAAVEKIPGVRGFFAGRAEEVPGQYDLITLIHALEHIPSPQTFLRRLREKLAPGGKLLVQVPDCEQNPFMFLVADHSSHFFPDPLRQLVARAGYEPQLGGAGWLSKEITILASRDGSSGGPASPSLSTSAEPVVRRLSWLGALVQSLRPVADRERFGIFGTSIAATWLFQPPDLRHHPYPGPADPCARLDAPGSDCIYRAATPDGCPGQGPPGKLGDECQMDRPGIVAGGLTVPEGTSQSLPA